MAEKKVPKSTSPSTGLQKFLSQGEKLFDPPRKGSGKVKYQNVIKSARVNTKKDTKPVAIAGKKLTESEAKARNRKAENLAKQIDREHKIRMRQRTEKPPTKKVPVKKPAKAPKGSRGGSGLRGGPLGSFGPGSGNPFGKMD
jgi:hypothetical protein